MVVEAKSALGPCVRELRFLRAANGPRKSRLRLCTPPQFTYNDPLKKVVEVNAPLSSCLPESWLLRAMDGAKEIRFLLRISPQVP